MCVLWLLTFVSMVEKGKYFISHLELQAAAGSSIELQSMETTASFGWTIAVQQGLGTQQQHFVTSVTLVIPYILTWCCFACLVLETWSGCSQKWF
jgi:hypothetical protein